MLRLRLAVGLVVLPACAPHGETESLPAPSAQSLPEHDDDDEQIAIAIARATLASCRDVAPELELERWDGQDWWNVGCERGRTWTSIDYESMWIRKSDGRTNRGARWTVSTQPAWLTDVLAVAESNAIREAKTIIGADHDVDCRSGSRQLHRFAFFCTDDTGRMWDVSVDTSTGRVRVERSEFERVMAMLGRTVE